MRRKTPLIVLAAFDILLWGVVLSYGVPQGALASGKATALVETSRVTTASATTTSVGVPVRIGIPRIAVNAVIESVGLAADGSMGVPKKTRNTAWYNLGPRPGETGSAVISGHVNWLYGATAVFAKLNRLKPGDKITVRDDKGKVISFVVRGSKIYGAEADATDVFGSNDGKAHLNLVTCGGTWDKRAKQYTKRLVVFADKQ